MDGRRKDCKRTSRKKRAGAKDSDDGSRCYQFRNNIDDTELKRAVTDFACCLSSALIPTVVHTSKNSERSAEQIAAMFDNYRWCTYSSNIEY